MATNLLIWISSVIVMGITAWIVSENNGTAANRVIYILVIVGLYQGSQYQRRRQTNTTRSPSSQPPSSSPRSSSAGTTASICSST